MPNFISIIEHKKTAVKLYLLNLAASTNFACASENLPCFISAMPQPVKVSLLDGCTLFEFSKDFIAFSYFPTLTSAKPSLCQIFLSCGFNSADV